MPKTFEEHLKYLMNRAECISFIDLSDLCLDRVLHNHKFQKYPGGITKHHKYEHGLVVHTSEVMQFALKWAEAFTDINYDVLITSVIFHDFAKIFDYDERKETILNFPFVGTQYRDIIRHVAGSHAEFYKHCPDTVPIEIKRNIEHCILSHHGRKEWGSPVEPQTKEAFILHNADMSSYLYGPQRNSL